MLFELDNYCTLCNNEIMSWESYLTINNKNICSNCAIELIEPIYELSGLGNIQHIIFDRLLKSEFNKKKRTTINDYKNTLNKLLHKYKFKCVNCGSKEDLTIDHIIPVSKGGKDIYSNYQILCRSCNSKKGNKM